ncbi:conserved hypothetical protein [uncultured Desulfatiglans sp.]|nr:conserved hypothetical protein [uncultured Desulfatiglans sp.]
MSTQKSNLTKGLVMMVTFFIVLGIFFSPVFNGHNGLEYLDSLYNSISKGSAYYIPKVKETSDKFIGTTVDLALETADEQTAGQTALLFQAAGAETAVEGASLNVKGDLGRIMEKCLDDADAMYHNDGAKVAGKYGYEEKLALYNWYRALKEMNTDLTKQKAFKAAEAVDLVRQKAVEASYNYYGIQPQKIGDRVGVVIFSLVFYVIYTVWYGFGILYLFEGLGLKFGH